MAAASHYFLATARLGFRTWAEDDFDLLWGLLGDELATRFVGGPFTQAHVRDRLMREIAHQRTHGFQYWRMFMLATSEHIGCCGLKPHTPERNIIEMGFYVRRNYWGRGYATEAARAVMAYAFGALHCSALFAGHHPENNVSRRVLEKLGFRYTHDEHFAPTGLHHRSYIVTRDEFEAAINRR